MAQLSGLFYRIKDNLPLNARCMFYNAYVLPILNYCLPVWGSCYATQKDRMFKLQKRFTRMILNDYISPVNALMKRLHILPIDQLFMYHTAIQMYKCVNGISPNYLSSMFEICGETHSYQLRDAGIGVRPPLPHLEISKRSPRYAGAHVWNSVPIVIRETATLNAFKFRLKQHLFNMF